MRLLVISVLLGATILMEYLTLAHYLKPWTIVRIEGHGPVLQPPPVAETLGDWVDAVNVPEWLLPQASAKKEYGWPDDSELRRWWAEQLTVKEIRGSGHIEERLFPLNLSDPTWASEGGLGAQYTRAWRRESILRMLTGWVALCAALNVTYWLDAGSLLGRARSAGRSLIPWDFDADVGMLREEFQKLNDSLNQGGRLGLVRSPVFGLPDGVIVWTRQAAVQDGNLPISFRDRLIPGRIIDINSGFYVDIFGDYFVRKDSAIQMFWPYTNARHSCSEVARRLSYYEDDERQGVDDDDDDDYEHDERQGVDDDGNISYWDGDEQENESFDYTYEFWGDCEVPCQHQYCYKFASNVVLPTAPCYLDGVQGALQCPRNEVKYLEEQYGMGWHRPERTWDASKQDFV